jgi:hypothetical protein
MWLDDLHLMIAGTIGRVPEARHDNDAKRKVIWYALCFATSGTVELPGRGLIKKWSRLRKELKTILFKSHELMIMSLPQLDAVVSVVPDVPATAAASPAKAPLQSPTSEAGDFSNAMRTIDRDGSYFSAWCELLACNRRVACMHFRMCSRIFESVVFIPYPLHHVFALALIGYTASGFGFAIGSRQQDRYHEIDGFAT